MNDKSIRNQSNAPRIDSEEILAGVLEWVGIESPSHDAAAVNRMADRVQHDMSSIGAHVDPFQPLGDVLFTFLRQAPGDSNRSPHWGNYPDTRFQRVILQISARYKLQAGQQHTSGTFIFPVALDPGRIFGVCDTARLEFCADVCAGKPCQGSEPTELDQRLCPVNKRGQGACVGICPDVNFGDGLPRLCNPYGFNGGYEPTFRNLCLPFQGVAPPGCDFISQCTL